MRTIGLMLLLLSTTAHAGAEMEPDDLPAPKPEVAKGEAKVDPPAVPTFELPAVEAGFHGVRELRVHGGTLQGTEVSVKGYVTSIYDCAAVLAVANPRASRAELLMSIDNDPRQCDRPKFYLGDTKGASGHASIWVVDVPRPPAKPERAAMSRAELAAWPNVPTLAVGDYVIVTGTWSTRSPHNEHNTNGLLVYKALRHAVFAPATTRVTAAKETASEPEIEVVTKAPLRKWVDVITRNASVDGLNACNKAIAAQQYDVGIAKCEEATRRWDGNHLAWYGVASAHLAKREWVAARTAAEHAVTLRPDEAMYQLYYGISLYEAAVGSDPSAVTLGAARDALRRATTLAPDLWRAHYYLGRVYRDLDDARRAAEQFTRVIATHPTYRAGYLALIELYRRWQYVDQALAVALLGIRNVSARDAGDLWFEAGMAYDEMRVDDRGLPPGGSAAEGRRGLIDDRGLPPGGSAAEGRRGWIDDQANAAFTKVLEATPDDKRAKFQRGQVYFRKGDLANARRDLESMVKSADPQLADATPIAAQLLLQIANKQQRETAKTFDCRSHGRCVVDDVGVVGDPR
jgi:tetratricopeptide (TPR) repeat protein